MAEVKPPPTPDEVLDLVEARAPALRALGVMEVEIGGVVVRFPPVVAAAPAGTELDQDEADGETEDKTSASPPRQPRNALEDPLTFGLRDGAKVPGFKRRRSGDDGGDPLP